MECWLQEVLADEGLRTARQESVIVAARVIRKPGKALSRPSAGEANHQIGRVAYLSGGAYWMPPAFHSWFRPRGMPSFEPAPTLRS